MFDPSEVPQDVLQGKEKQKAAKNARAAEAALAWRMAKRVQKIWRGKQARKTFTNKMYGKLKKLKKMK